ncbi:TetR family transcriptional regulator [Pseudomonas turukhanskensis]|uniref:TetR family transcriptional regulator n=1 Tax=Pseudomonas turukhanskensis TaxID=1806536 RepID=A0A9W6K695_9PSED|nr:TetR family transcriptional regulator [Pseudomonas turukhanskensis]GLK88769.1 TetR family transcriptional regulator [Pseudomonas turukhanskensis]
MVRRTKEEAQETRSQILDAAEKAFYEHGVGRTTLARIADVAGVTRGAIYWHFSNKSDLFQAMLERAHLPFEELAKASESATEPDPLGRMRELLVQVLKQTATDAKVRRINEILFHKCEYTEELNDLRQQMQDNSIDCDQRIELTLRNAINKNQLPADLDTQRAAICLHSFIDGVLAKWLLAPKSLALGKEAERIVDAALDMLRLSPGLRV